MLRSERFFTVALALPSAPSPPSFAVVGLGVGLGAVVLALHGDEEKGDVRIEKRIGK